MGVLSDTFSQKDRLDIVVHASTEGYCSAAILVALCHIKEKRHILRFIQTMDVENDISVGHPDAHIPTAAQVYKEALAIEPKMLRCSLAPLLASLARQEEPENGIVQDALAAGLLGMKVGFTLHGSTRPVLSMIESALHPYLGGSTEAAKRIFAQADVNPFLGKEQKTFEHLTDEEIGRLQDVLRPHAPQLLGQCYHILNEEGWLRDAREAAIALKACEAFGLHTTAVGLCLGDRRCRILAGEAMTRYRKETRRFMESTERLKAEKPFHFLPLDDMSPALVRQYANALPEHVPTIVSSGNAKEKISWLIRYRDHVKLAERIAQKVDVVYERENSYSIISFDGQEEGRILEFTQALLKQQEIEEPIDAA